MPWRRVPGRDILWDVSSTSEAASLVALLDGYLDAVPRPDSDAVAVGPFTLFMSRTPWSYYARPSVGQRAPIASDDIDALATACQHRGVPLSLEWVQELNPELAELAAARGLAATAHPLMTAAARDVAAQRVAPVAVRIVGTGDPAIAAGRAVADVAFTAGGTSTGPEGTAERDGTVARLAPETVAHLHDRARRGLTVTAVAESTEEGVLAVGSYQPVGGIAEVVAVATLPSARRRGTASALTVLLACHARQAGVQTLLLSAQGDEVAGIYEHLGFRRVGTACAAEV